MSFSPVKSEAVHEPLGKAQATLLACRSWLCKAGQLFASWLLFSITLAYQVIQRVPCCFSCVRCTAFRVDLHWLLIFLVPGRWNPGLCLPGQRKHLQRVRAVSWWGGDDSGPAGGSPWVWHGQCHRERPELRGLGRVPERGQGRRARGPLPARGQVSGAREANPSWGRLRMPDGFRNLTSIYNIRGMEVQVL